MWEASLGTLLALESFVGEEGAYESAVVRDFTQDPGYGRGSPFRPFISVARGHSRE